MLGKEKCLCMGDIIFYVAELYFLVQLVYIGVA